MPAAPTPAALPPFAVKLLKMIGHLIATGAHAQVIVHIRDGKVQLLTQTQQFKPENLPE